MAIYESAQIDKRFTDRPITVTNPAETSGVPFDRASVVSFTAADHDDGDQMIVMAVPSNAVVRSLELLSDGGNTAGTLDIGVYTGVKTAGTWTLTEGATGSQDFFTAAQAIATALTTWTDVTQDGDCTQSDRARPLWEAIGAASDPGGEYLIVAEVETADIDADVEVVFRITGVT